MSIQRVDATRAKRSFAELHARARVTDIAITKHGQVQAYMVSPDRYRMLEAVNGVSADLLSALDNEFEALVERMQGIAHRQAVESLETAPLSEILADGALASRSGHKARRPAKKAKA